MKYKNGKYGWQEVATSPVSAKSTISRYDNPNGWGIKQELARGSKFRMVTYEIKIVEAVLTEEEMPFDEYK